MNTDRDFILNTISILMNRHNSTISTLVEKSKSEPLSVEEQSALSGAFEACETYNIFKNRFVKN